MILGLLSRCIKVRASNRIQTFFVYLKMVEKFELKPEEKKLEPENIDLRSLSNLSYWFYSLILEIIL